MDQRLVYKVKKLTKSELRDEADNECAARDCYEPPTLKCVSANYERVEHCYYCSEDCLKADARD